MKNKYFLWGFVFVLIILTITLYIFIDKKTSKKIVINEICYSSEDNIDWVELYNPTLSNISIKGLYLTDNAKDFSKYKIKDDLVVPAGGYLVVYGENYEGDDASFTTLNFNISDGETIYLVAEDGSTILDSMVVLSNDSDIFQSVGRYPDANKNIYLLSQKTPGEANIQ